MNTDDYQAAVAHYASLLRAEVDIVHEAGVSRLLGHGVRTSRAYLLLHGTTNSPAQWLEFGRMLFDLGHNVFIPRAPYHGLRSLRVGELAQLTAADLHSYAHEAVAIGRRLGDELVLVGISGGGTVAAWAALNHPEIGRTVLDMPFFGLRVLPDRLSLPVMKLLHRLPDFALANPGEARRSWVYHGQSSHGAAAYLSLAADVLGQAREGAAPAGKIIILTTASDRLANNDTTARLVEMWRRAGVEVVQYHFPRDLEVPHNAADPAADPRQRQLLYQKMMVLLDEPFTPLPDHAR